MMITWIILVSLVCKSTQHGNGQENGVLQCGPQNLTLTSSDQMIMLTWTEDDPSCSAVHDVLVYELVVLKPDSSIPLTGEVSVMPDQIGSSHSWNWISPFALECFSHSVRIRSRYNKQTSPWKQEHTHPGMENLKRPGVYPKDRFFEVGSNFTFCCILPAGEIFNNTPGSSKLRRISNQTYAFTVHMTQASNYTCNNVYCPSTEHGACAYIGYPPQDKDLQCETRDLQSVECHWTFGGDSPVSHKSPTVYHLLGRECREGGGGLEIRGDEGRCKMEVEMDSGEINWTLTAENKLGKVELLDRADLIKRVHMIAPNTMTASTVNARNVTLEWEWTVPHYSNLKIKCHVNISHGETHTIREYFGVGLNFTVLNDLIPYWKYNVTVRCGTTHHLWKWSEWSTTVNFHTRVPDALDVWRQAVGDKIIIIWKMPLANQSHGNIKDYRVTWEKTRSQGKEQQHTTVYNNDSLALSLDMTEEYIVTVTTRNEYGSSSPSTITIPSRNPVSDGTERANTSWIVRSSGSFNLSWSPSPAASCGYIVDWCPTVGHCKVEWLKVSPNQTNARIFSKNFTDGVRYLISVYACTQEAPVLLDRSEDYVRETRIKDGLFQSLKWKQKDSDVEVYWDPINQREQSAFIRGYVLYWWENDSSEKFSTNASTVNPEDTSLTARKLPINNYKFIVMAKTAVGECGTTNITVTLNPLNNLVKPVLIPLLTVFGLLSLITILCYQHWTCIKQKVYPPVPEPVLTWPTSPGENRCRPLHVDQYPYNEPEFLDVSELHYNLGQVVNGNVSEDYKPFASTQTPGGYINQPLKKSTSPPLTLLTIDAPSSPFRSVFSNPSYNLLMETGDQQSSPGPRLQEGTPLGRSFSEYQPQSNTQTFNLFQTTEEPRSPMSCDSTYIVLPKST
ncbi:oncostatin-M-specific receptor subunit beta-like [Pagrus major]|uniref:oncostatin-M-specific receptor subunit beta-like n=1 Tax=Pagrus major TaxID=143350 RepID=UPI003CC8B998